MKTIKIELEIDDDEYKELLENELIQGNLRDFIFAELCQNWGMGFLINLSVTEKE